MKGMRKGADWSRMERVLCVRLDAMGDVLMTIPALRALKAAAPQRKITLLTSPSGAAAAGLVPDIDDVIVHEAPWMKHPRARGARSELAMIDRLKRASFGGGIIFTVYSQNPLAAAYLCYLAGIPARLGYCRENPYRLLTQWVPETEPETEVRHEVRRQLDLVRHAGAAAGRDGIRISIPAHVYERVDALLAGCGIGPSRRWILVHPGASAPSRRYPAHLYARVAALLSRRTDLPVLFTGSPDEAALVEEIRGRAGVRTCSLAGKLDTAGLAAAVSRAAILISNNTGPVHMASAVGTKVVDLYALTNPQHTPWKVRNRVLFKDVPCRFCYKSVCPGGDNACISRVSPAEVADAACALLEEDDAGIARGAGPIDENFNDEHKEK